MFWPSSGRGLCRTSMFVCHNVQAMNRDAAQPQDKHARVNTWRPHSAGYPPTSWQPPQSSAALLHHVFPQSCIHMMHAMADAGLVLSSNRCHARSRLIVTRAAEAAVPAVPPGQRFLLTLPKPMGMVLGDSPDNLGMYQSRCCTMFLNSCPAFLSCLN